MAFPRVQIAVGDVIRCYEVLRTINPLEESPLAGCRRWGALTVVRVHDGVVYTDTGSKFVDKALYALGVCQVELAGNIPFAGLRYVLEKAEPLAFIGFPLAVSL